MTENIQEPRPLPVRLLVADDEESMRYFLKRGLLRRGFDVDVQDNGESAWERFQARPFDLALLDLKMPGIDGLELLEKIREANPESMVILMTGHGTIRSAVDAMKRGAFDYITKPFELDELILLIERALKQRVTLKENRELRHIVDHRGSYAGLVGQSPGMKAVYQTIDLLRDSNSTVLLSGESGTGKELVARAIHINSPRSSGAFVAVNCAALPETLVENELFGHEVGAFTGATSRKKGFLERADRGTLFLDEVSEINLVAQVKLLRFLQEREFTPLGSTEPIPVDLRVIAATNRDLEDAVAEKSFRQDLFWRLHVIPVHLPPLRERPGDSAVLIEHFVAARQKLSSSENSPSFSLNATIAMSAYSWPGNVRELQNTVERLLILYANKNIIDVGDLPSEIRKTSASAKDSEGHADQITLFGDALSAFEQNYLKRLLEKTHGNVSQAAHLAGISRPNLHRKIKQLSLDPDDFRP